MPTKTFLRLPEEKRERFIDAAWAEFARTGFAETSIANIVKGAGIARGSFYQYFADKDDLFDYLQDILLKYLVSQYCHIMKTCDGDMFRTQVACFDRVASLDHVPDVLFSRCTQMLRLNPGLLPRVAMEGKVICLLWDGVQGVIETNSLRNQDSEFVSNVFALTLVPLAVAVAGCLKDPANTEKARQSLLLHLDIIKQGSLAESCRTEL